MDQYISTYRKDFMWPYVRTLSIITDKQSSDRSRCKCGAEPGGSMPPKEYVGPPEAYNYQWSRLGPMAPLLDPKLYPAKMGPPPEFEIMRYDQPNTYLKKLQEKYPYLYNVLQSAPPDEMIRRVNEDRLRTTYQVDYEHIDEHPSGDYEKLLSQAGISNYCSKSPFQRESPPILDCRAQLRPPDYTEQIQPGSDRFAHQAISNDRGNNGTDRGFGRNSGDLVTSGGGNGSSNRHEGNGGSRRSGPEVRGGGGNVRNEGNGGGNARNEGRGGGNARNEGSEGGNARNEGSGGDNARNEGSGGGNARNEASRGGNARNEGSGGGNVRNEGGQREGRGSSRNMRHEGNGGGMRNGPDARGGGISNEGNKGDRGGSNVRNEGSGGGGGKNEGGRGGGGRREEGGSGVGARGSKNEGGGGGGSGSRGGAVKSKKSAKAEEDKEASKKPLPAWRSEYQEVIGQTGMDIIRDKLHQHGDRSSGRSFAERIIMKCRA